MSICISSLILELIHDASFSNALKYDAIFTRITKYVTVKSMIKYMHNSEYCYVILYNREWLIIFYSKTVIKLISNIENCVIMNYSIKKAIIIINQYKYSIFLKTFTNTEFIINYAYRSRSLIKILHLTM